MLTVLVLLTHTAFAQAQKINQIDSLMQRSNQMGVFNGNVLVSKNNKIVYQACLGFTDATQTTKLTPDYRFNIGSITKEFSAVALLQLEEQGKLKLTDKVSKFIPELPQWANEIALKHLLNYTSGLPNVNWKKIKNDTDLFEGLKTIDTLDFTPGTQYDYNNNVIFLRQFIIARLTAMPYKTYVEKFLFKPSQMSSTIMTPFEKELNIAKAYTNSLVPDKADLPITGGTYLTTTDLLKWANRLYTKKIIRKKALYALGQSFDTQNTQSALGEAKYKGQNLLEHLHDGRAGNYEAVLLSDIPESFTIILLSNNYNGKVIEMATAIAAIMKDQKSTLPKK